MPTRREQLQGYRFVTRRIVSAMLSGEPESTMLPMRRLGLAVFASAMVGVILFAAVGVYGLLWPGGRNSWRKTGTFIIERESGARYVYEKGELHPILNYASARLIVGSADPQQVSANSLRGVPRGAAAGIYGAPDSVPDAASLVGLPWTVCSSPKYATTTTELATELMVGRALPGGAGLGDKGLLVSQGSTDGTAYLLWHDRRYRIPNDAALTALGLTGGRSVVGSAMLGAIPSGPDLAVPAIPGKGEPGRVINDESHQIGDVFQVGETYYLLLDGGLTSIGEVTAQLILDGAPATKVLGSAVSDDLDHDRSFEQPGMPDTLPQLMSLSGNQPAVCAAYHGGGRADGSDPVRLRLYAQTPTQLRPDAGAARSTTGPEDSGPVADRIVVPGGRGALVRQEPAPGVTAGTTVYLVTDQGRKYALMKSDKKDATVLLGYQSVRPVPVPPGLLDLVPTGPPLDPAVAGQFTDIPAPSPTASAQKQHD